VSRGLRPIVEPFVVSAPAGARVRTRLVLSDSDALVLRAVGGHLGTLAAADLDVRCQQRSLDAKAAALSRRERKQALTAGATSRWAGAITRTSNDAWDLAERNLQTEARSLRARVGRIRRRLAAPVGGRSGRVRGYASRQERWEKQRRAQALAGRLAGVEARLTEGRVSVCRGGRGLARARHNLAASDLSEDQWRQRWRARRWFITADGEKDKTWGNETIRWHPQERWLEVKLPAPLAHLANRRHGRYRLSCPVGFPYRGEEVAAQAATGAIRYDISYDSGKNRWHLDASWTFSPQDQASLHELRHSAVLAADLNIGHLATWVIDPSGNPAGLPQTLPLDLTGLPAATRDGLLRAAISELISIAKANSCAAIVVENLDFTQVRTEGRERSGRRPSTGRRGRGFRYKVASTPTGRFRDRLVQMAANAGLAVIAVDPAYTSRWAAQYWLQPLQVQFSPRTTGHHAAAVVIGRRGLGQRARRRERRDSTRPEDRGQRAANSAVRPAPASAGLAGQHDRKPADRKARRQPDHGRKTRPAERASPGTQGGEDRSLRPEERCPVRYFAEERYGNTGAHA
jgi:IS605 OrfB family transposase